MGKREGEEEKKARTKRRRDGQIKKKHRRERRIEKE